VKFVSQYRRSEETMDVGSEDGHELNMSELFRSGPTSVDRDWIKSSGKSYAIRQIRTVRMASYRRMNGFWQLSAVLAALTATVSIAMWHDNSPDWKQPMAVAAGLIIAALALFRLSRTHLHVVYITQASVETAVFQSHGLEQAQAMKGAIEAALSGAV
jgi:hypothetical protein